MSGLVQNNRWKFSPMVALAIASYLISFGIMVGKLQDLQNKMTSLEDRLSTKVVSKELIDVLMQKADVEHNSMRAIMAENRTRIFVLESRVNKLEVGTYRRANEKPGVSAPHFDQPANLGLQ